MTFRIQDLMTDVLPEPVRWATCPGGTTCRLGFAASSTGKGDKSPQCRPASCGVSQKPGNPKPGGPAQDYTDLALLRQRLRQALDGPRA